MFELFYGCMVYLWIVTIFAYLIQTLLIALLTNKIEETHRSFAPNRSLTPFSFVVTVWINELPIPYSILGRLACWGFRATNIVMTTSAIVTLLVWMISGLISGGQDYDTPQWNGYGWGLRVLIFFVLNFVMRFIVNVVIRGKKATVEATTRTPSTT